MTVPGTNIRIPVRKGPAGDLLMWAAARWHREVEPLVEGWNWGWAYRAIRGASQLSNHASGTAIDLNAPRHPLGVAASKTLTPAQIATIRRIVADSKGCLTWGGTWGRPDAMHFEISANEAKCAAVLKSLTSPTPQEDDVRLPDLAIGDGIPDKRDTGPNDPGRKHWYVLSAQALLNIRGLSKKVTVDGFYGQETAVMVKELQRRSKLPETGRVDSATWQWLLGNDSPDWA